MTAIAIHPTPISDGPEGRVFPASALPCRPPLHRSCAIQWNLISITLITLAIISRVGMIAWPFLNDSGLFAAMGKTIANGGVLYRDFYETKLPGVAPLAAAFWICFDHHWVGYVLCQLLMTIIASAALSRITRPLPTFLFAIVFLNLSQAVYTGFQLETIQAFFEALAAYAAVKGINNDKFSASFAAGLFAGMAAMAKPGGLCVAVAFGLTIIFFGRRRLFHLSALFIGVAIPAAGTVIYTFRSGASSYLPGVLSDIHRYAIGTPVNAESVLKVVVVLAVLGFPFAVRLIGKKTPIGGTPMLRVFFCAWFIAELISVLIQRRLYPYHFLPLACPAALLYGLLPWKPTPRLTACGLLPVSLLSLTWEGSSLSQVRRGLCARQ